MSGSVDYEVFFINRFRFENHSYRAIMRIIINKTMCGMVNPAIFIITRV